MLGDASADASDAMQTSASANQFASDANHIAQDANISRDPVDGGSRYRLEGFVSHMGANTGAGHYVCHVRGEGDQWLLFNDAHVAVSQKPPREYGYLYMYVRI